MLEPRKRYKIAHFIQNIPTGYMEDSTFKITDKINENLERFTDRAEVDNGCRLEANCYVDQMSVVPEIRSIRGNNAPVVFDFHTDLMYYGVVTLRIETAREFLVNEVINEDKQREAYGALVSVEYYLGEESGCE